MSRYFWIIFVLLGLWQFIGSLAERATKKQQDQRVSDLTAQRRKQQVAARRTEVGGTARGATAPVAADRAGELAARRKAQLDELRRRRGAATAQPAARTRPAPTTLRPALPPTTLRPALPPTRPPMAPPVAAPQVLPAPVRHQPAAKPQARRATPPQKLPIRLVERSTETPRRKPDTGISVEVEGARKLTLPGLGDVPMDRTLLRRMVLYHEILEPPIALREVQSWER